MPLLAAIFSAMGIVGGYLITVVVIGVDAGAFWSQMEANVDFRNDILNGVIKSIVFGGAVTAIAVFEGYDALPTAEGVSHAVTRTVVTSALAVLALDPSLMMYDEPFAGLDPISVAVIANLIRRLNSALGATSIVVTHDVEESFKIVDYVYFISQGEIVAQGTPAELRESEQPYVRQFVQGKGDGPVRFHYPAGAYDADLGVGAE